MVKAGRSGHGFIWKDRDFFDRRTLKEGLGRIQVETKVHGLIRDMEATALGQRGADSA